MHFSRYYVVGKHREGTWWIAQETVFIGKKNANIMWYAVSSSVTFWLLDQQILYTGC